MVRKLKFDFNVCLKKGLLRRIPESAQKADSSLKAANKWIDEAEKNLASLIKLIEFQLFDIGRDAAEITV
jgi:hypothetical protein